MQVGESEWEFLTQNVQLGLTAVHLSQDRKLKFEVTAVGQNWIGFAELKGNFCPENLLEKIIFECS